VLNEELLEIGDKVDLLGHQNRVYRTMIEDMVESRAFLVGIPRFSGIPMPLHLDDSLVMFFYRDWGRYVIEVQVIRFDHIGDVRYVWLCQKTEPVRNQRREAFRVSTIFDVTVCKYVADMEKEPLLFGIETVALESASSRDVSMTGVSMVTRTDYEIGQKFLLKMYMDWPKRGSPPFHTCATVARTLPWRESDKNIVGMSYIGHTRDMNEYVAKYVFEEQRRQLRQKRLNKSE